LHLPTLELEEEENNDDNDDDGDNEKKSAIQTNKEENVMYRIKIANS
jgi:hypothetical protein